MMREKLLAHLPPTPATHFRLYFYAAVLHIIGQTVQALGSFEATLDDASLTLLVGIGLAEEDTRFGLLFEAMQGTAGQHRPTQGLLNAWWRDSNDDVRAQVRRLQDQGLARVINPDAPRVEWAFEVPPLVWDALRGEQKSS